MIEINEAVARKVLEVVDCGLVNGLGMPVPGSMCVEAAVCYAMGLPHSDEPDCVSPALRRLKITLNDSAWSSNEARAKGLRRLALAQLGSAGVLDDKEFARRCAELAIRKVVPIALRAAAKIHPIETHKLRPDLRLHGFGVKRTALLHAGVRSMLATSDSMAWSFAARKSGRNANDWREAAAYAAARAAADAADAAADAADAAYAAERDRILSDFAEDVVTILKDMNAPGCQWLSLTETQAA